MKIRILSDLHIDVNDMYDCQKSAQFDKTLKNNDIFTIIAGDTAGHPKAAIDWIKKHVQSGLVIAGNHIVYNKDHLPIQNLKHQMANAFPKNGPITFLDHMTGTMSKEVNGILFIGTTLYTDYALFPDISLQWAMRSGWRELNDFHFGYTKSKDKIRHLTPMDYRDWFNESLSEMSRLVESHPKQEIVIITHHCPSEKCCSYPNETLNASYASNLEPFIQAHPNVKLWVTGHAHERKNFKIGNCRIVMNPRGYEHDGETLDFNPNTFVDTTNWSVHQRPLENAPTKSIRKALFQQLLRRSCFEL